MLGLKYIDFYKNCPNTNTMVLNGLMNCKKHKYYEIKYLFSLQCYRRKIIDDDKPKRGDTRIDWSYPWGTEGLTIKSVRKNLRINGAGAEDLILLIINIKI